MAIDMSDPRLQQLLQKRMAKEYWGGIAGFAPEVAAFAGAEAKRNTQMGQYYLQKQMQDAQIGNMKFQQEMANKRLGLEQNYLGLGQQEMGVKQSNLAILKQMQEQRQSQGEWEQSWFNKTLAQKERELNLTTGLGLATAGWSAYEGGRRAKLLEEDRALTREFKRKMQEKGLL